jgi:hypothetical protein
LLGNRHALACQHRLVKPQPVSLDDPSIGWYQNPALQNEDISRDHVIRINRLDFPIADDPCRRLHETPERLNSHLCPALKNESDHGVEPDFPQNHDRLARAPGQKGERGSADKQSGG